MQIKKEQQKTILISVEGVDGVGKTTLISGLMEKLRNEGVETILYKVPSGKTKLSNLMHYLFTQRWYVHGVCRTIYPIHLFLVYLETLNVEHDVSRQINGNDNVILIADRSIASNYVYPESRGETVRAKILHNLFEFFFKDITLPKYSIFLHAEPKMLATRITERGETIDEAEIRRLAGLQKTYMKILDERNRHKYKLLSRTNIAIVDGNSSKEEVLSSSFEFLRASLM